MTNAIAQVDTGYRAEKKGYFNKVISELNSGI